MKTDFVKREKIVIYSFYILCVSCVFNVCIYSSFKKIKKITKKPNLRVLFYIKENMHFTVQLLLSFFNKAMNSEGSKLCDEKTMVCPPDCLAERLNVQGLVTARAWLRKQMHPLKHTPIAVGRMLGEKISQAISPDIGLEIVDDLAHAFFDRDVEFSFSSEFKMEETEFGRLRILWFVFVDAAEIKMLELLQAPKPRIPWLK